MGDNLDILLIWALVAISTVSVLSYSLLRDSTPSHYMLISCKNECISNGLIIDLKNVTNTSCKCIERYN